MASVQPVPTGKAAAPAGVRKNLKPIKTKLRLKKEDFRQCRLCMRVLPREGIRDATAPESDLRWKIMNAVSVKITTFDKVTSVCINCIRMVDIINDFRMSCRKAETLHGTKLLMLHPGDWLNDKNKLTLLACQQLAKRHRTEMDALFKCSGLANGDINWLTKGEEVLLEPKKVPVRKVQPTNAPVKVVTPPPEEDKMDIETEELVDSDPEMSEQFGRQLDAQVEEAMMKKETSSVHYMCELCGKLVQKMYMEQHTNLHVGRRPYGCPEENCDKRFASSVQLSMHVNNTHSNKMVQQFECETCHKTIKRWNCYQKHLLTHQATNPTKVPCQVCGKTFYKSYLRDHMFVHTGEMPYKCEFCGREFAARNNWVAHKKKHHSDQLESQG